VAAAEETEGLMFMDMRPAHWAARGREGTFVRGVVSTFRPLFHSGSGRSIAESWRRVVGLCGICLIQLGRLLSRVDQPLKELSG